MDLILLNFSLILLTNLFVHALSFTGSLLTQQCPATGTRRIVSKLPYDETFDDGGWITDPSTVIARPGPCNIDVRDASSLSQEEFLQRYAFQAPVVIRRSTDNSVFATRKLSSRDYMLNKYGSYTIRLSSANTHSYEKVDVSLRNYVENIMKPQKLNSLGNETFYWFGDNNHTEWAELFDTYKPPPYTIPKLTGAYSYGLAGPGTGVPFHFHGPGFAEVIYGIKNGVEFILMIPGEAASFPQCGPRVNAQMMTSLPSPLPSPPYPLLIESVQPKLAPEGIPIHFSGSVSADQGIDIASRWFFYVPNDTPNFHPNRTTLQWLIEDYPKLPSDKLPLECTVEPGEAIYFPDMWWHATLNINASVFISTFLG